MSAKVTAKAVSQVQNQIPQFITEEFPLYEKFLKHYYEFLETLCVYFSAIDGYTSEFTVGETVTGITTGATATVKATERTKKSPKRDFLVGFLRPWNWSYVC